MGLEGNSTIPPTKSHPHTEVESKSEKPAEWQSYRFVEPQSLLESGISAKEDALSNSAEWFASGWGENEPVMLSGERGGSLQVHQAGESPAPPRTGKVTSGRGRCKAKNSARGRSHSWQCKSGFNQSQGRDTKDGKMAFA